MAGCPLCGRDTSIWGRDILTGICSDCTRAAKAESREAKAEARELEESRRRTAKEQAAEIRRNETAVKVMVIKKAILKRLEAGSTVILYHSIYLPVDSVVLEEPLNSEFDTSPLFEMGLRGWEAIQVVPRTIGIGLKNTSIGSTIGVTWGGAVGGNVAGVHVLLKKTLVVSDIDIRADDELASVIRSQLRID